MIRIRSITSLLIGCIFLGLASVAEAVPVTSIGQPVTAIGSNLQAVANCSSPSSLGCFNPSTGMISYFIPINPANAGIYGVTDPAPPGGPRTGTFADSKTGPFTNSEILTMYLRFSPVAVPAANASLTVSAVDLDLIGGSDPTGFTESVQFFYRNGNNQISVLSPLITTIGQLPGGGDQFQFTVSGNSTSQTITFANIASIVTGDPFYLEMRFGSQMTLGGRWTNVPESLTATLTTTPVPPLPVPEPSSVLLLGSGLLMAGVAVLRTWFGSRC